MICLCDLKAAEKVGILHMPRMCQRKSRLDIQRLDAQPAHQTANPVTTHIIALCPQLVANLTASIKRILQMDFVDLVHKFQVFRAQRYRSIVEKRSAQIQEIALPCHRKRIPLVDHRFTLASPMRPSAPAKKSFSIESCPIFA
jgi:hypothetical protein